jgi:hypothetical protein
MFDGLNLKICGTANYILKTRTARNNQNARDPTGGAHTRPKVLLPTVNKWSKRLQPEFARAPGFPPQLRAHLTTDISFLNSNYNLFQFKTC